MVTTVILIKVVTCLYLTTNARVFNHADCLILDGWSITILIMGFQIIHSQW